MHPAPEHTRDTGPAADRGRISAEPSAPPKSGLTLLLWLLAALIAEAELLLWALERSFAG